MIGTSEGNVSFAYSSAVFTTSSLLAEKGGLGLQEDEPVLLLGYTVPVFHCILCIFVIVEGCK